MLKVALVGCGGIAQVHAKVISEAEVEFVGCCDEKAGRAKELAEKFNCKAYGSLKELLDAEKPDIVHITTPHYTHAPLAVYALNKGVNVFLEKPAVSSPAEIQALINEVKVSKKQLGVCFQNRYNYSSVHAKKLIESGKAGKILGARAFVNWSRADSYYTGNDWRGSVNTEGASVLINQSIHTLDLLQWLMGDPIKVEATVSNRCHKGVINTEDSADASLYYENGVNTLFYASVNYCVDATISIEVICENMKILILGEEIKVIHSDGTVEELSYEAKEAIGKSYWGSGHKSIINDFYEHIRKGAAFPLGIEEGIRAVKTCFKIIESKGKTIMY